MKAFSSPSLGTKGSDTCAVLSHIMVVLRLRRLLFPVASAVPLIATSRIEPCLQVSLRKGAKHAVEKGSGAARPGPACPWAAGAAGAGSRGHLRAALPTRTRSRRA